jgi:hypothetical protein
MTATLKELRASKARPLGRDIKLAGQRNASVARFLLHVQFMSAV